MRLFKFANTIQNKATASDLVTITKEGDQYYLNVKKPITQDARNAVHTAVTNAKATAEGLDEAYQRDEQIAAYTTDLSNIAE